jgi:UDP-N-acetylglucosamine 2-epimerase (non-hydrolysing)
LTDGFPEVAFVYPVHLNPQVQQPVHRLLRGRRNVHLLAPVPYAEFVWLMDRSTLIQAGVVEIVGTTAATIVDRVTGFLAGDRPCVRRSHNPYGDGRAAEPIVDLMLVQGWHRAAGKRTVTHDLDKVITGGAPLVDAVAACAESRQWLLADH